MRVEAGAKADGSVTGWRYRHVSASILGQRGWTTGTDSQATEGSTDLPYVFGSSLVRLTPDPSPIPVGFWRSVGHLINAFAVESAIDELAASVRADPFWCRAKLMVDHPLRHSWCCRRPNGVRGGVGRCRRDGRGVWRSTSRSGRSCARWSRCPGRALSPVRVHGVLVVVDCGTVVNPDTVEAQMQGGVIHGLNAALAEDDVHQGRRVPEELQRAEVPAGQGRPHHRGRDPSQHAAARRRGSGGTAVRLLVIANALACLGTRVRTLPFSG